MEEEKLIEIAKQDEIKQNEHDQDQDEDDEPDGKLNMVNDIVAADSESDN